MSKQDMRDYLIYNAIATEDEIDLVAGIYGDSEETYKGILYYRTGESSFPNEDDEDGEENEE